MSGPLHQPNQSYPSMQPCPPSYPISGMMAQSQTHQGHPNLHNMGAPNLGLIAGDTRSRFKPRGAPRPPRQPKITDTTTAKNPVSQLQEVCQKNGALLPNYQLVEEIGPSHARKFKMRVHIGDIMAEGVGATKQKGKVEAAKAALEQIYLRHQNIWDFSALHAALNFDQDGRVTLKFPEDSNARGDSHEPRNDIEPPAEESSVNDLMDALVKRGLPKPEFRDLGRDGPHHAPRFTFECIIKEPKLITETGTGISKKAAKKRAARNALDHLNRLELLKDVPLKIKTKEKHSRVTSGDESQAVENGGDHHDKHRRPRRRRDDRARRFIVSMKDFIRKLQDINEAEFEELVSDKSEDVRPSLEQLATKLNCSVRYMALIERPREPRPPREPQQQDKQEDVQEGQDAQQQQGQQASSPAPASATPTPAAAQGTGSTSSTSPSPGQNSATPSTPSSNMTNSNGNQESVQGVSPSSQPAQPEQPKDFKFLVNLHPNQRGAPEALVSAWGIALTEEEAMKKAAQKCLCILKLSRV